MVVEWWPLSDVWSDFQPIDEVSQGNTRMPCERAPPPVLSQFQVPSRADLRGHSYAKMNRLPTLPTGALPERCAREGGVYQRACWERGVIGEERRQR